MADVAREDLQWLSTDDDGEPTEPDDVTAHLDPGDIQGLRSAFIEAFNARDLESLMELLSDDVEFDNPAIEGHQAVASELIAIWERSPDVFLTRAFHDDEPCAVAWRPDEVGGWARTAMLCFDVAKDLIVVIEIPDDAGTLATAVAEDPAGEELEEWFDWDHDLPSTVR